MTVCLSFLVVGFQIGKVMLVLNRNREAFKMGGKIIRRGEKQVIPSLQHLLFCGINQQIVFDVMKEQISDRLCPTSVCHSLNRQTTKFTKCLILSQIRVLSAWKQFPRIILNGQIRRFLP